MARSIRNSEEGGTVNRLAVRWALKSLPKKQYDAILYCDILGFTQAEAGRILGCDQRNVGRRLESGRKNLKKKLDPTA